MHEFAGLLTAGCSAPEVMVSSVHSPRGMKYVQSSGERVLANDLGKSKIAQLDTKFLVGDKDILGLDISMDNTTFMLVRC